MKLSESFTALAGHIAPLAAGSIRGDTRGRSTEAGNLIEHDDCTL